MSKNNTPHCHSGITEQSQERKKERKKKKIHTQQPTPPPPLIPYDEYSEDLNMTLCQECILKSLSFSSCAFSIFKGSITKYWYRILLTQWSDNLRAAVSFWAECHRDCWFETQLMATFSGPVQVYSMTCSPPLYPPCTSFQNLPVLSAGQVYQ